jgi:hypothetical protein
MATKVTNKAAGGRGFNVKVGKHGMEQVVLQPGQTADLDLVDIDNPIYKSWKDRGDIVFGADEKPQAQAAPAPVNAPAVQPVPAAQPAPVVHAAPAAVHVPASAPPAAAVPPAARAPEPPKKA